MNLDDITPVVLTYNEERNLSATLNALRWAKQIVIVDSSSSDQTLGIAAEFPAVTVHQYEFDNHPNKWNHGIGLVESEWVLTLDADYVCSSGLPAELTKLVDDGDVYYCNFRYCVLGRPLRSSLYPPRAVLFRPRQCQYLADGHTQLLDDSGRKTSFLESVMLHDDHKPIYHWFNAQISCAKLEATKLRTADPSSLSWKDKIRRRYVFAPILMFFYCLIVKRLILDGWHGVFYTFQRVFAELTLSVILIDQKLRS